MSEYQLPFSLNNPQSKYQQLLRLFSSRQWWLKKLRQKKLQCVDQINRDLTVVNRYRQIYTSNYCVTARKNQLARNQKYLNTHFAENDKGERLSLLDIAKSNVSNPAVRRAEMMVRVKGFEMIANQKEHACLFLTITAPSKMHSSYSKSGKKVKSYNGSSPKEVNDFLCHEYSLIRSKLERKGIRPYGLRVVEPHHDGTPHWHLLMFVEKKNVNRLKKIFKFYLSKPLIKKSHIKRRLEIEKIDITNQSATGYVAKYISKNIDGEHVGDDFYGNDARETARRIDAWASTWNIRQFQFMGGPSVTAWRELRKLRKKVSTKSIEPFRQAADAGDWAAYVLLMGGTNIKRSERPLQLLLKKEISPYRNEQSKKKICGVYTELEHEITRLTQWKISSIEKVLNAENTGRDAQAARFGCSASWTSVNNCTGSYLPPPIPPD
ncbi:replication endonuclease [Pleionea sediminis]|uniref:replication endonuclease n=1 Tax=Pleionea sediminis TaxID=2569479 RepID=UPI001FE25387